MLLLLHSPCVVYDHLPPFPLPPAEAAPATAHANTVPQPPPLVPMRVSQSVKAIFFQYFSPILPCVCLCTLCPCCVGVHCRTRQARDSSRRQAGRLRLRGNSSRLRQRKQRRNPLCSSSQGRQDQSSRWPMPNAWLFSTIQASASLICYTLRRPRLRAKREPRNSRPRLRT